MSGSDRKDSPKDQQKQPSTTTTVSMALMAAAPPKDAKKPFVQKTDEFAIEGEYQNGWLAFSGRWLVNYKFDPQNRYDIVVFDRAKKAVTFKAALPHSTFEQPTDYVERGSSPFDQNKLIRVSDSLCGLIVKEPLIDRSKRYQGIIIFNPANPSQPVITIDVSTFSYIYTVVVSPNNPNSFLIFGSKWGRGQIISFYDLEKKDHIKQYKVSWAVCDIAVRSDSKLVVNEAQPYSGSIYVKNTTHEFEPLDWVDEEKDEGEFKSESLILPKGGGQFFQVSPTDTSYFLLDNILFASRNNSIRRVYPKGSEADYNEQNTRFLHWLPDGSLICKSSEIDAKTQRRTYFYQQLRIAGSYVAAKIIPGTETSKKKRGSIDPADGSLIVEEEKGKFSVYQFRSVLKYLEERKKDKGLTPFLRGELFELLRVALPAFQAKELTGMIVSYLQPYAMALQNTPSVFSFRKDVEVMTQMQLNNEFRRLTEVIRTDSQRYAITQWWHSSVTASARAEKDALVSLNTILATHPNKDWSACVREVWSHELLRVPLRELGKRISALGDEIKQIESGKAASATATAVSSSSSTAVTVRKKG